MLNNIKTKLTREVIIKAIFAFLFSWFNVSIYMTQNNQLHSPTDYHIMLINVMICTFIVYKITSFIISKLPNWIISNKTNKQFSSKKYYWIVFAIHMICWTPVFLAYYPGLFAYDVHYQIPEYTNGYSTHHPLAHTLILQFFYFYISKLVNSINFAIALSTIFQMAIFALSLSFVHLFLLRMKMNQKLRWITIILTSLLPVFSVMAISLTKDIIYASFIAFLITMLGYYCCLNNYFKQRFYICIYIISIIGVILFRNNGIYPVIAVILWIAYQSFRKKTFKVFYFSFIALLLGIFIQQGLVYSLHAKNGSINEKLSLPYVQIACTYMDHKKELKQKYIEKIHKYIPSVDGYQKHTHTSDHIKWNGNAGSNLLSFTKLYVKLFFKYPYSYVKAFSLLNAGYLSLSDTTFASFYGVGGRGGIFLTDTKQGFNVEHISYLPKLEYIYERFFSDNKYLKIFVFNILFSPALYFWVLVFFLIIAVINNKKLLSPLFIFTFIMIFTIFLGPGSLIRYALPYIICVPVIAVCLYKEL